jgi:hypothetical protein
MTREVRLLGVLVLVSLVGGGPHLGASGEIPVVLDLMSSDAALTNPGSLTTDGVNLFVANGQSIVSIPIAGGAAATVQADAAPVGIRGLTRLGTDLFWIDPDGDAGATAIFKAPIGGGAVTSIYSALTAEQIIMDGTDIAADGAKLYTTDAGGQIHSLNADGSGVTFLGANFGSTLSARAGMLYAADAAAVTAVPASGAGAMTLFTSAPLSALADVAAGDDGFVYVADREANTIWRIPAAGGVPVAVASGAPFVQLAGLAYWQNALYVSDRGNTGTTDGPGAVYRVKLPKPNAAPVAEGQSIQTGRDKPAGVTLSATDADGDPLDYIIADAPAHGTLSGIAPNVVYTPAAGYLGPDSFRFAANDGMLNSNVAIVSILVQAPTPTTTSVTVTPSTRQYSDRVTFEATVTPSVPGVQPPAKSVTFKIGSQSMGTAPLLPAGVTYKAILPNVALLEPSSPSGQLMAGSKMVTAVFNEVNSAYTVNSAYKVLTITREDARVTYTGPNAVKTSSTDRRRATVKLSATIRDISATPEGLTDVDPGDVRKAILSFVNRDTGVTIAYLPVTQLQGSGTSTGTVSYDWTVDIGNASSKTFKVALVVSGYYTRNAAADDVSITVSK